MLRAPRTGGVMSKHGHAFAILLALGAILTPLRVLPLPGFSSPTVALTANADESGGVVLSRQEIDDAIRWGVEHNRTPEDIQKDIDGLNNARGGSGPVTLPVELQSVDTPSGRVTATGQEAADYYLRQARVGFLRAVAETHKEALKALEAESNKWAVMEQLPVTRALAAHQELKDAYGDLQADLLLIKAKVLLVNRKPTRTDYGWAYREGRHPGPEPFPPIPDLTGDAARRYRARYP